LLTFRSVVIKCQRGTFTGPLCSKCLIREVKKRTKNGQKAEARPAAIPVPTANAVAAK
jgi:hypothetical protein